MWSGLVMSISGTAIITNCVALISSCVYSCSSPLKNDNVVGGAILLCAGDCACVDAYAGAAAVVVAGGVAWHPIKLEVKIIIKIINLVFFICFSPF